MLLLKYFHFNLLSVYYLISSIFAEPLQGHNIVPAEPNELPFIASIGLKNLGSSIGRTHICTGSLVSIKHVLSAAHCFRNQKPKDIDVIIGVTDLETAEYKYDVHTWVTYDQWIQFYKKSVTSEGNDLAIVKLLSPVNQRGVTPIELTTLNNLQVHRTKAIMAGWGRTNDGFRTNVLQKAKVKILTDYECEKRLKLISNKAVELEGKSLCTASDPHTLMSKGDSGGPLLSRDNVLLGINTVIYIPSAGATFPKSFLINTKSIIIRVLHITKNIFWIL